MKQSRWMSFAEAVVNGVVGYGVAAVTPMLVFPLFGMRASVSDNLLIGVIFTMVSMVRSFTLRRVFESLRR